MANKEELALDTLATTIKSNRAEGWKAVALLLPMLNTEIGKHLRLIRSIRPQKTLGKCLVCGLPRPHRDHASRSHHARIRFRKKGIQRFWDARPDPETRAAHTLPARTRSVEVRHQTWLEALPPRLVRVLGPTQAIGYWRGLSSHQQRKLLRARKLRVASEGKSLA